MSNQIFTFLGIILFIGNAFGQTEKDRKWSVEAGLLNSAFDVEMTILPSNKVLNTKLKHSLFFPKVGVNRRIDFKNSKFSIQPFVGVSMIGANRDIESIPFEVDSATYFLSTRGGSFQFVYLDFGSFLNYSFHNIDFQFGIKGQYFLDYSAVISLDYSPQRVRLLPNPSPDGNELQYDGKRLADFTACAGFRIQYNFKRYFFATEFWQGLTDLSLAESDWFENKVFQHNFGVSFGFKF